MKKDSNYTFQVSISQKHYETKAQAKAAITGNAGDQSGSNKKDRISYLPVNITPCQLLDKVLNGYTFCALFSNFKPNCKGHVYVNTDGSFTSAGKAGDAGYGGEVCQRFNKLLIFWKAGFRRR